MKVWKSSKAFGKLNSVFHGAFYTIFTSFYNYFIHLTSFYIRPPSGDGQTEAYLKDTGMAGLTSAWAMARRRPKEYRLKVDAATRCSGVCPHI